MRILVPVLAVAALISVLSTASARPAPASHDEAGTASTEVSSGGRIDRGAATAPEWFGGKWWRKLVRAMKRFLEFIDGLIDDLRNQPGDEPGERYASRPSLPRDPGPRAGLNVPHLLA